jgi:TRAP-type mannitol/chloroaromatic compound transport system substrate-binding protein
VAALSDNRLTIRIFGGGELVPAFGGFDAVASGTAQLAHDPAYYHMARAPALAFYTTVPFGLTATELDAWVNFGGGQKLWEKLLAPFGLIAFHAGNTGHQMAGWFRREINAVADLKGLRYRMPGQGGQALAKLGVVVSNIPAGEIFGALQSGALDGTEWVGPYNDLTLGFHQVAKFYYWPGFHEPGAAVECLVNKAAYDALPKDLQTILRVACTAENNLVLSEYTARSLPALDTLVRRHGVQLRQMPRDVLVAEGTAAGEVMQDMIDRGDALTREIADSYLKFRKAVIPYTRIGDQAFLNARVLNFPYPG